MIPRETIAVLTPVYNEKEHLGDFLDRLIKQGLHILVVDDGSTDGSGETSLSKGVETLRLPVNKGKGHALQLGLKHLVKKGFGWIIVMDSDGQHLPEEIPLFIESAESASYGVINGNRLHHPKGMPILRILTNRLMSFIVSRIAGQAVLDSQCGFKMLSTDFLRKSDLRCCHFEIEDELLLEAARLKYRIGFVPITSVYARENSHIDPLRDTLRFIRFIWVWRRRKHNPPCS